MSADGGNKLYLYYEIPVQEIHGTSTKVSMWKCYCKAYWKEFLLGGILKMMGDFVGYVGPLGVSVIVNFVANTHKANDNAATNSINDYGSVSIHILYIRNRTSFFLKLFQSERHVKENKTKRKKRFRSVYRQ